MLVPVLIAFALALSIVTTISALFSGMADADDRSSAMPRATTVIACLCALTTIVVLGYALDAAWSPWPKPVCPVCPVPAEKP